MIEIILTIILDINDLIKHTDKEVQLFLCQSVG